MPPHCDSMDGPVVKAAMKALEARDVALVLPFVPKGGEAEVGRAFDLAVAVRPQGAQAREVADLHFFETVVRVHRAGEGAPYTGLRPAGLGHGPVVPVAEQAIERGSPEDLVALLARTVEQEVRERFDRVTRLKPQAGRSLEDARMYVGAMLGLEVYAHRLYECARADPHDAHHDHEA